ncbi:MAG TPA: amidase family protein [Steroidobacteraceae bacterium]|nr:amidase family protein [Steroidobacteraceae bacterium]
MSGAHRAALLALDAAQLRSGYADHSLDPIEVTDAVLAAAAEARHLYCAVTCINDADARQAAAHSAVRWREGRALGPLDGVPMTFKDSFNIRGLPRWHGSAVNRGDVSPYDAAPVRRAREAGIVIAAKTSMPDYGLLMSGLSSHSGIVRNPWDPRTNPAGSSSGGAACLACGVAPLALGTDMVGSVRLPAAACGLASIHATQGRVAYDPPGNYRGAGPMARSVADVAALLQVVGRHDPADHYALPGEFVFDPDVAQQFEGSRIGVLASLSYGDRVDEPTRQAVALQADLLAGQGADMVALPDLDVDAEDYAAIYWSMVHKGLAELYAAPAERRGFVQPEIGRMCDQALGQTALFMDRMARRLSAAIGRLQIQLAPYDFILSPASPVHSFPADAISPTPDLGAMSHMGFACWFNQLARPAGTVAVMQAGHSACPVSVQIAGRRFDDAGVLRVLRRLEELRGFAIEFPILDSMEYADRVAP